MTSRGRRGNELVAYYQALQSGTLVRDLELGVLFFYRVLHRLYHPR